MTPFLIALLKGILMIGAVLSIANLTVLVERKLAGRIQGRVGPNRTALPWISDLPVIGPFLTRLGLFQPIADGLKFLFKEDPVPGHVNKFYYFLAPCVALIPALTTMTVLPFGQHGERPLVLADLDIGVLFILAVSSLGVYGIILAGWSSNSKYPFLGGIRASAQMISYELGLALSLLPVFMWANHPGSKVGLSLFNVVQYTSANPWIYLLLLPSAALFLVCLFAETNRLPFDMPESETDLVAGYNTEFGAFKFGLFFAGEYAHIIVGSGVFVTFFLGGWKFPFVDFAALGLAGAVLSALVFLAKVCAVVFLFIWVRWTLPRFRFDQVMNLGWKVLLPLALANLVATALIIAAYEVSQRG